MLLRRLLPLEKTPGEPPLGAAIHIKKHANTLSNSHDDLEKTPSHMPPPLPIHHPARNGLLYVTFYKAISFGKSSMASSLFLFLLVLLYVRFTNPSTLGSLRWRPPSSTPPTAPPGSRALLPPGHSRLHQKGRPRQAFPMLNEGLRVMPYHFFFCADNG